MRTDPIAMRTPARAPRSTIVAALAALALACNEGGAAQTGAPATTGSDTDATPSSTSTTPLPTSDGSGESSSPGETSTTVDASTSTSTSTSETTPTSDGTDTPGTADTTATTDADTTATTDADTTATTDADTTATTDADTTTGSTLCGDGARDPGELCDDGNAEPLDGCEANCKPTLLRIEAGGLSNCVLFGSGDVRCWGGNEFGQLGYGHTDNLGDDVDELPTAPLELGGPAEHVVLGWEHTCALLVGGVVRCWGRNDVGQLGQGHTDDLGDDPGEMPPPAVPLGGAAIQLDAGDGHTCALLDTGVLRCWGSNKSGKLGQGHTDDLGDDPGEMPPPPVPIGEGITQIHTGANHNCVRFAPDQMRCWGRNSGALGYGHALPLGDEPGELPTPWVPTGSDIAQICGGLDATCIVTPGGAVHYWGSNFLGKLGMGNISSIGSEPGDLPTMPVPVGGSVVALDSDYSHSCALLDTGAVRCWGAAAPGTLGYADVEPLGDELGELPTGDVAIGGPAIQVSVGLLHSCALLASGGLRCWGSTHHGALGLGPTPNIGDTELPDAYPLVPVY